MEGVLIARPGNLPRETCSARKKTDLQPTTEDKAGKMIGLKEMSLHQNRSLIFNCFAL